MVSVVQSVNAEELQRLFTTPQERADLEWRRLNPPEKVLLQKKIEKPPEPPPVKIPAFITFNGLLRRSHGPTTVWLNGSSQPVQEGFVAKVEELEDLSLPVVIGDKNPRIVKLKPGQTVDTTNGQIKENFTGSAKIENFSVAKSAKID